MKISFGRLSRQLFLVDDDGDAFRINVIDNDDICQDVADKLSVTEGGRFQDFSGANFFLDPF